MLQRRQLKEARPRRREERERSRNEKKEGEKKLEVSGRMGKMSRRKTERGRNAWGFSERNRKRKLMESEVKIKRIGV